MNHFRRAFAVALLVVPLAFAACGGDSDEDQIKAIVADGSKDPKSICDHASKALLEQLEGKEGCEKLAAQEKPDDKEADVKSVKIDGDKATADIVGDNGPQKIQFVKEDGDWKVAASS